MNNQVTKHNASDFQNEEALITLQTAHLCSANVLAYRLEQARKLAEQQPQRISISPLLHVMTTAFFTHPEHAKAPLNQYLPDIMRIALSVVREYPGLLEHIKSGYKLLASVADAEIVDIHFYYLRLFGLPKKLNIILQTLLAPGQIEPLSQQQKLTCKAFHKALAKDHRLLEKLISDLAEYESMGWQKLPLLRWVHESTMIVLK